MATLFTVFKVDSFLGPKGEKVEDRPPGKMNECPLKRDHFKRKVVLQPLFFRGYVSFRGSNIQKRSTKNCRYREPF